MTTHTRGILARDYSLPLGEYKGKKLLRVGLEVEHDDNHKVKIHIHSGGRHIIARETDCYGKKVGTAAPDTALRFHPDHAIEIEEDTRIQLEHNLPEGTVISLYVEMSEDENS